MQERKLFGFTLAETLITLGIIGVIAAMTIPSLMTNYQKKMWESQLKKAFHIATNACERMLVEENVAAVDETRLYGNDENFNTADYFKVITGNPHDGMTFSDGIFMTISPDHRRLYVDVDLNGEKQPNTPGRDQFGFYLDRHCAYHDTEDALQDYLNYLADAGDDEADNYLNNSLKTDRFRQVVTNNWEILEVNEYVDNQPQQQQQNNNP